MDARIPTGVLIDRAPEVPWDNLMGSGVKLPDSAVKTILELWGDTRLLPGQAPAGRSALFQQLVTHAEGNSTVRSRDLAHLEKLIGTSGRSDLTEPGLPGCAPRSRPRS